MTYEYVCTACGHQWEASQSIKDAPLKECPSCHGQTAKRQVSGGTGFVLKGSGWYADLYSSAKPSKPESASEGGGEKAASSKSDGTEKASSSTKAESGSTASTPAKPSSAAD
jgi:putative FmdB family regulatory protein